MARLRPYADGVGQSLVLHEHCLSLTMYSTRNAPARSHALGGLPRAHPHPACASPALPRGRQGSPARRALSSLADITRKRVGVPLKILGLNALLLLLRGWLLLVFLRDRKQKTRVRAKSSPFDHLETLKDAVAVTCDPRRGGARARPGGGSLGPRSATRTLAGLPCRQLGAPPRSTSLMTGIGPAQAPVAVTIYLVGRGARCRKSCACHCDIQRTGGGGRERGLFTIEIAEEESSPPRTAPCI